MQNVPPGLAAASPWQRAHPQPSAIPHARRDPGRQWALQFYSCLLPQLPELPPSTLASLSRCLLAWEAAPAERWLATYWRALEAASGDMYAEGILQVVSAVVLRGMRPSVALLQKLALAAERMLGECSPETQVRLWELLAVGGTCSAAAAAPAAMSLRVLLAEAGGVAKPCIALQRCQVPPEPDCSTPLLPRPAGAAHGWPGCGGR
jgi:hypothetical protein